MATLAIRREDLAIGIEHFARHFLKSKEIVGQRGFAGLAGGDIFWL